MLRNGLILGAMIFAGVVLTLILDHQLSSSDAVPKEEAFVQGVPVPEFSFTDTKNVSHNIKDYEGKVVVLNFWATWCAPCVKEMPLFMDMAEEYPDKVVFIGLSSDFKVETMQDFIAKLAAKNPQALEQDNVLFSLDVDGATTRNVFQTYRLPETIIIDSEGIMREKLVGADWDYLDLQAIIQKY